jgi:hypothetical protein
LQIGNETGGEVNGTDLSPVTELQHRGDEIDDDRGEELGDTVVVRDIDITHKKTEIERGCKDDKKAKDDFL